jgi:hypothetical protein
MLVNVQMGNGVAITDAWSRERSNDLYRYITLNSSHVVSLAWRKSNQNPAIPLFVNELTLLFHS